jgi:hypothetical protein
VSDRVRELAEAMEAARYRSSPFPVDPAFQELRLWMMRPPFCRLHPAPPVRPCEPVSDDVAPPESPADSNVIVASESPTAPHKVIEDAGGGGRGVTMQLDIAVERRRSFWWRLAASLVIRRLGR